MGMTRLVCSNCSSELGISLVETDPSPILGDELSAAVRAFVAGRSGRFTSGALLQEYEAARVAAGWPALSARALGRALRAVGATPWRTTSGRGWVL